MAHSDLAPFADARASRQPGLFPLDLAQWMQIDALYPVEIAQKDRLLREERAAVFAATPGSEAAQAELLAALVEHLAARPDFRLDEGRLIRPDGAAIALESDAPLALAGRLVQEDLCLLELPPESDAESVSGAEYRLSAASLCFPSRWLLSEKIGRPLTPIHGPVPDYDADLARRVNRVFAALPVERPLWRANWAAAPTGELRLPPEPGLRAEAAARGPFWLRVERQTLRRLPRTRAVVFGIRIHARPFASLQPEIAAALKTALAALTPAEAEYRGGEPARRGALAHLEALFPSDRV